MSQSTVRYRFVLPGADDAVFDLAMDETNGRLEQPPIADPPPWAALEFRQCPNCPLSADESPLCPVARSLVDVVPRFEPLVSYDQLTVIVETEDRTIRAERDVQAALSSMIGLIMASSGCPHTSFFRPMARFHLPLSNERETTHRVVTNWLLARHLCGTFGEATFDGLLRVYEQLQVVNAALTKRLSAAGRTDSTLNAVVLLDLFALLVPAAIDDSLAELKVLLSDFVDASGQREAT
ncbi:MAG: hypothetical protein AAFU65_01985 [Pseudomonadota bacterium]